MTTDQPYTPTEEQVRIAYMGDRITYDGLSGEEALAEWAAFLARVRRDAAREALDGLAAESMGAFKSPLSPPDPRSWAEMAGTVEWYRDTHHPEETP